MIRLLLVDDHPVVRAGLRAVLSATDDLDVRGEAATAAEAVRIAERGGIDLVLMDLRLGEDDGVTATRTIRALPDPPHVLILTTFESGAHILRAVQAGATGYLLKDADPDTLVRAIRSAASGGTVLASPVASQLLAHVRQPAVALTARELEIVQRLDRGDTNREIAGALTISEATVKSHLVHMFSKLGVNSRTKVVAEARRCGLL
ncbi:response regulator transcription factor [Kitasatospora purpeofusca]|uniref:response regulator transcription factor n=1 Tax=Kitasatospora purpeofusca TaxID=67352 RepID=UPI0030F16850